MQWGVPEVMEVMEVMEAVVEMCTCIPEVSNILLTLISSNLADLLVAGTTVFDHLGPYFVRDALYNSGKREEEKATMCQEGTRTRILQEIRQWADGAGHPVCWLSGPAGTGKTTIAHTIAKEYDRNVGNYKRSRFTSA
jgi:hypothetical protein